MLLLLLKVFSRRILAKATAIGYTLGARVGKSISNLLLDNNLFYESYVVVYGISMRKIYTKTNTLYLGIPYLRGHIFSYGATISQTPITLFINADSRCLRRDLIEKVIESLTGGHYSLYIAIPFTTSSLTAIYRDNVYAILRDLGIGLELIYPSYTLVVGKTRIFKDAPSSLWSSEILASLLVELTSGKSSIKVDNTGCIDQVPQTIASLGDVYMGRLTIDIISMLLNKKVIDEAQAKKYLKGVVNIN